MVLGGIAVVGRFPDLCISRWSFLAGQHLWQYLQFRDWKLPGPPSAIEKAQSQWKSQLISPHAQVFLKRVIPNYANLSISGR